MPSEDSKKKSLSFTESKFYFLARLSTPRSYNTLKESLRNLCTANLTLEDKITSLSRALTQTNNKLDSSNDMYVECHKKAR